MGAEAQLRVESDIVDVALAESGRRRTEWAFQSMPVLQSIRKQFIRSQPFQDLRIAACLHVTTETANLMITLRDGGASVLLCASNSLSTQDDVAATLVKDYHIPVYAIRGASDEICQKHLDTAANHVPQITLDDGAALVTLLHRGRKDAATAVIGGTEETASGVVRLRAMARDGALEYPVVAVNDAATKHLFDNRYGTGQSVVEGIIRAANVLLAGMTVVVAGFGRCGRGIAQRARGMGANVIVTEIHPIKATQAVLEGYRVMSMMEAAAIGDLFITATGNKHVIRRDHFDKLKNGAILANAGHADVEIDLEHLARMISSKRATREFVEEYAFRDGRRIFLLGEGRPVNLIAAEGHPASVMDMSFANQALAVEYLVKNRESLEKKVYGMPDELDQQVARLKLEAMGVKLDRLTPDQESWLANWQEG
jgi:adenosylhomocysteinase